MEARGFRDLYHEFEKKDAIIFGVSVDSEASHRRFINKENLPFDLLVDPDLKLCRLYRVDITNLLLFKLIARVTYVIDKAGIICAAFESVNPNGHAKQILVLL